MRTFVIVWIVVLNNAWSSPKIESQRAARHFWEAATSLYNLGEFTRAADQYRESYRAIPDVNLLYDIAQCYRLGKDLPQALFFYKSFLRNAPGAPNRDEVEDRIHRLESEIASQQQVTTMPPNGVHLNGVVQPEPKLLLPPPPPPLVVTAAAPRREKPLYKKWWLWTAVGVAAASAVAVGLGVGLTSGAHAPSTNLGNAKVFE